MALFPWRALRLIFIHIRPLAIILPVSRRIFISVAFAAGEGIAESEILDIASIARNRFTLIAVWILDVEG